MDTKNKSGIVCFINPPGPENLYRGIPCAYISKANYTWQPHDFINLSAQVPDNYDLKLIDCSIDNKGADYVFGQVGLLKPALCVIAISSIIFEQDLCFLKEFKVRFPGVKCLVLGNILLEDVFWNKVLEYADGLILNSLDIDLGAYIKTGKADSPNLIFKERRDIGLETGKTSAKKVSIGLPRHKIFINKKYRFPFAKSNLYSTVSSQFGCPFQCGYCSWSKIPVSYRDCGEVLEEIELIRNTGVRDIFFADSSFGFPKDNTISMLEGILKKDLRVRWSCYTNPLLLDKKSLQLMKRAGCHTVITGVDDDNFGMLKERYNRDVPKVRLIDFCRNCHELGINVCGNFIIGLEGSGNSIERLIDLTVELKLDYASFNIYAILVGSLVRERLIKEGKFDPFGISADPSGNFGSIDERLIRLRNLAVKRFYLRPAYLLNRICKIRSSTEFMIQVKEMKALFKTLRRKNKGCTPQGGRKYILP